jgi:uncharacterized membrane protein
VRRGHIRNLNEIDAEKTSFGGRLADRVAAVGGSWAFIIWFLAILFTWTLGNSFILRGHAFDDYPYIFLNLVLSMLAAIQAPVIMMSQNRAAERDRHAAQLDYEINMRAEHEIVGIHERMDREIIGLHKKIDALLQHYGVDPTTICEPVEPTMRRVVFAGEAAGSAQT